MIENFRALLERGQDNPMLRLSLGNAYLKADRPGDAIEHLQRAVEQDPGYSAAWKLLGQAFTKNDQLDAALEAYARGIAVAEQKGDKQAAKEMAVFKRRIERGRA